MSIYGTFYVIKTSFLLHFNVGGVIMTLLELKNKFISLKSFEPTDLNQLMDFLQQNYLKGEVTFQHYRALIKELELSGAYKPN